MRVLLYKVAYPFLLDSETVFHDHVRYKDYRDLPASVPCLHCGFTALQAQHTQDRAETLLRRFASGIGSGLDPSVVFRSFGMQSQDPRVTMSAHLL